MSQSPRYRHLRTTDYRVMPWKNGGGSTTEIAVAPPGATLEGFDWRVSIADVATSGPFSTFPGCDRILVQTDGAPMTLEHDGRAPKTLEPFTPYAFDGDEATAGRLGATPVRDFNVIARRARVRATVTVIRERGEHTVPASDDASLLVHAARGDWDVIVDGTPVALGAGETVVTAAGAKARVATTSPGGVAFVVRITPAVS
jgi:hypothetical protein